MLSCYLFLRREEARDNSNMPNNFMKRAIGYCAEHIGHFKRKNEQENKTQRSLKIYRYLGDVTDEGGCHGTEYSLLYMLSTKPDLPNKFDEIEALSLYGIWGKTDVELKDSIELKERDIRKLSRLEKEAIRKKLYRKFGVKSLKVKSNIYGPFYLVYSEVYDRIKGEI